MERVRFLVSSFFLAGDLDRDFLVVFLSGDLERERFLLSSSLSSMSSSSSSLLLFFLEGCSVGFLAGELERGRFLSSSVFLEVGLAGDLEGLDSVSESDLLS